MSTPSKFSKSVIVYGALTFLAVLATTGLAYYLFEPANRETRFTVSLLNLLVGEILVGAQLIRAALRPHSARSFIFRLSGTYASILYLIASILLCVLALTTAPIKLLVALHVILLVLAISAVAIGSVASEAADNLNATHFPANSTLSTLKDDVRKLYDRSSLIKDAIALPAIKKIAQLQESVRFSYSQSDGHSINDDNELAVKIQNISQMLAKLEQGPDVETSGTISSLVDAAIIILRRRNDGIARRR